MTRMTSSRQEREWSLVGSAAASYKPLVVMSYHPSVSLYTLVSRCLTLQLISCQSLGCSEGLLGVPTSASCPGKNWCSEQRGPDHKPSLGSFHTHSTYRVLGMKINFSEWLSCTFVTRVSSEPEWCHLSRRYGHSTSGQKSTVIFPQCWWPWKLLPGRRGSEALWAVQLHLMSHWWWWVIFLQYLFTPLFRDEACDGTVWDVVKPCVAALFYLGSSREQMGQILLSKQLQEILTKISK